MPKSCGATWSVSSANRDRTPMRRPHLRTVLVCLTAGILLGIALLGLSWWRVSRCGQLAYQDADNVPPRKVGLVLGCSPKLGDGSTNWFFSNRMDAAAALFRAGKV